MTKRHMIYADRKCYACDSMATGLRDRTTEGGTLEHACSRHADPKILVSIGCVYCSQPIRKGSLSLGTGYGYAHRGCHKSNCL